MTVRLYLAGPEVFFPDAQTRADEMRSICRRYDLEPISPLDGGTEPLDSALAGRALADAIFDINIRMIERADAVVANLNHFRGPDPDAGTCFEVGYGYARGKRTYAYYSDGDTAVERVERHYDAVSRRPDGTVVDRDGLTVENFGSPFNLMLSSSSVVVAGSFEDAIGRVAADVADGVFADG